MFSHLSARRCLDGQDHRAVTHFDEAREVARSHHSVQLGVINSGCGTSAFDGPDFRDDLPLGDAIMEIGANFEQALMLGKGEAIARGHVQHYGFR